MPNRRLYVELPAGQGRAFAHAAQANATRINRLRTGTLHVEANTVISNRHG